MNSLKIVCVFLVAGFPAGELQNTLLFCWYTRWYTFFVTGVERHHIHDQMMYVICYIGLWSKVRHSRWRSISTSIIEYPLSWNLYLMPHQFLTSQLQTIQYTDMTSLCFFYTEQHDPFPHSPPGTHNWWKVETYNNHLGSAVSEQQLYILCWPCWDVTFALLYRTTVKFRPIVRAILTPVYGRCLLHVGGGGLYAVKMTR